MVCVAVEKDVANTVRDFTSLCDYIENNNPAATQKGVLSVKACYEINQLLSRPEKDVKANSRMDKYASITLWLHVAKVSGLIDYSDQPQGKVVFEVTAKYAAFKGMSVFSQYMFIFYAWLCFVDSENLYDRMGVFSIDSFFSELGEADPAKWCVRNIVGAVYLSHSSVQGLMNLYYKAAVNFMDLGLLVCDKGVSTYQQTEYPIIERLKPTLFGTYMMKACKTRRHSWFNEYTEPIVDINETKVFERTMKALEKGKETFLASFVSLFPQDSIDQESITKILFEYEKEDKRIYDFRVSLGKKFHFVIRCSPGHSFEDLHLEIQKVLKFDNDHLYSFYLDGKKYSNNSVNSPYSETPPYTDDTLLGDVRLRNNQRILYLFDYGDCWQFIIVVKTTTEVVAPAKPEIIEITGEPPEQYPNYDWEK